MTSDGVCNWSESSHFCEIGVGTSRLQTWSVLSWPLLEISWLGCFGLHDLHHYRSVFCKLLDFSPLTLARDT